MYHPIFLVQIPISGFTQQIGVSDARQSSLYSSQLTFRPPLFYIGDSIRKGKYIYKSISFPIILPRGSIDDVNNQLGKQDCVPSLYIQTRARTCPQLTMIDSDTPITRVLYIFFGFHVIALELSMSTVTSRSIGIRKPLCWQRYIAQLQLGHKRFHHRNALCNAQ